jgi:hypothetical protein
VSRGTIYDLGYKRYVGTRRPQSTRWGVIARHQLRAAWKGFWRYKLALVLALINVAVWGVLMAQEPVKAAMARFFTGAPEDIILGWSYTGLGWFDRIAFIVGLTVAAGSVANDAATGAFQFYFARPVRPIDYVLGKLAGFWLLFAIILIGGPLILAAIRLGMYEDGATALANATLLLKVIGVGALAALTYAGVTLAVSALSPSRRYAYAVWAAYHLVLGTVVSVIGARAAPIVSALDITSAISAIVAWMVDVQPRGEVVLAPGWAVLGLVLHAGVAIGILYGVVARGRSTGIGGS